MLVQVPSAYLRPVDVGPHLKGTVLCRWQGLFVLAEPMVDFFNDEGFTRSGDHLNMSMEPGVCWSREGYQCEDNSCVVPTIIASDPNSCNNSQEHDCCR